jgi:putative hydrolase
VSSSDPLGGSEFPFGDLSKLFSSMGGADPWVQAEQIAQGVANEGMPEDNVDPLARIAYDDLARVADLHLRQIPGVTLPSATAIRAVNRSEWTSESLVVYRPFFERFGEALGRPATEEIASDFTAGDPLGAMFGQMIQSMGPMMVAMSAGAMIGHLGQQTLGQYDLPVPRPTNDVLVVPSAIDAAAAEWELPLEEVRLWVLVHELAAHATVSLPHVRRRLDALFIDFATAFRLDSPALLEQFSDITDLSRIGELAETLNDPNALFDMMRTATHDLLVPQLDALVAIVTGFIDHVVTTVCGTLVPSHEQIRYRLRSRTADDVEADQFMERLLGLNITERTLERGSAFIAGVIERVGDDGLNRLWKDELDLPTAAEVDAPGLWLARIGLDPDLPDGALEIPDDLSGLDEL